MKKILLPLLAMFQLLSAGPNLCDYQNAELSNISFTDSLMTTSSYWFREAAPGSQGPTGADDDIDSSASASFILEYDSLENAINFIGKGRDYTFNLDEQKRVTRIQLGYINYTKISYGTNELTIQDFPNDSNLTSHSREWNYKYRDDGQVNQLIITPSDWDTQTGPKYWGRDNADTLTYSYDSEDRISGIKKVYWTNNLYHSEPWKRHEDSLKYTYGTEEGKPSRTITQYSPFGSEWKTMKGDTQWVSIYNENGQIIEETERRWDGSSNEWDQLYFTFAKSTYQDSLLLSRREVQYYGKVTARDSFVVSQETYTYGPNTIRFGTDVTPILTQNNMRKADASFIRAGNRVELTGATAGIDRIAIFTLNGRQLRVVENKTTIDTSNLNANQPFLFVAYKAGAPVVVNKLILQ